MKNRSSEYMHWAKTESRARFNLATSGVGSFPLQELDFDLSQLEVNGPGGYFYAPLRDAIARQAGVDPGCVVTADGTSMANHLAMAALIDAEDEVLIESPTYGLLVDTARYFTSRVRRFERREDAGWALDPDQVSRSVTAQTRLIVLTNLHNPSSALATEGQVGAVGDIARTVNARVLVDEVYLDAAYQNPPRSAIHLGPEFIVTSSLTKVYGLSGLRCGWILAPSDLAEKIWRLNDLFGSISAFPAAQLSVAAFAQLGSIRERARAVLELDRAELNRFLDAHPELHCVRTGWGTTALIRPPVPVMPLLHRLRAEYETTFVPGRFFDAPHHLRAGMGVDHEMFGEGLRRLESALSDQTR